MQPPRWTAWLPRPAQRAGKQWRRRHMGLEPGRRNLHDQPLAPVAVLQRQRGHPTLGTSTTVARVGDQIYATAPGEAFPEVTTAIEHSFAGLPGINGVHIIDHASDQLGYYWDQRPGVYPAAQIAQSDFARYNVGSQLAQDNVDAVRQAGQALGLDPSAQQAYAQVTNPNAFSQPTIQFYPDQVETAERTVSFYGTARRRRRPAHSRRRSGRRRPPRATAQSAGTSATAPPRPTPSRSASRIRSGDRASTR